MFGVHFHPMMVRSFVFGGLDGIITVFALVTSSHGASVPALLLVIMALANMLADALSMGMGDYLSSKAEEEADEAKSLRAVEHVKRRPAAARAKLERELKRRGYSAKNATKLCSLLSEHPETMSEVMLAVFESNEGEADVSPEKCALVTATSFCFFGSVPLLSYLFHAEDALPLATLLTACTLFTLGAIKSRFGVRGVFESGFEVAMLGMVASLVAYGIANALSTHFPEVTPHEHVQMLGESVKGPLEDPF